MLNPLSVLQMPLSLKTRMKRKICFLDFHVNDGPPIYL